MPNQLRNQIEALLFISGCPLKAKKIAKILNISAQTAQTALEALYLEYLNKNSGLAILKNQDSFEMTTSAPHSQIIQKFLKKEQTAELTKPSLETLTVIAYRGPLTKAELDLIRGVNSALILRNLMIRGLIEEIFDHKLKMEKYQVSLEFLKCLGLPNRENLPDFDKLSKMELAI